MMKLVPPGLVVFAGILSNPTPGPTVVHRAPQADPRIAALQRFFEEADCPAQYLLEEFLEAADRYNLDWRLLPSISMVESGGGRNAPNNNLFGWDSGRAEFDSAREAIRWVASRLAKSKLYRDKDVDEILKTYNPEDSSYCDRVRSLMQRIGPVDIASAGLLN